MYVKQLGPGLSITAYSNDSLLKLLMGWFLYDVVGTLSPSFIILYCYSRVLNTIKTLYRFVGPSAGDGKRLRFSFYTAIPIICFLPWIIVDLVYSFIDSEMPFLIVFIVTTFRRAWGFLNLLAYWFLRPQQEDQDQYDFDSSGESGNESDYSPDRNALGKVSQKITYL